MNRDNEDYLNGLAGEILKAASDEVAESPFIKTASEADINEAVAEKIASVYDTAAAIYKEAADAVDAASDQEAAAREVLEAHGIDPDEVLAAAEEAAAHEMGDGEDEDDEAEKDDEDND